MLGTMIVAWILTWFNLDNLFIEAINQIFNVEFNTAIYWLLFLIVGIVIRILEKN